MKLTLVDIVIIILVISASIGALICNWRAAGILTLAALFAIACK